MSQNPFTMIMMWYGVQHITKAPRIKLIIRRAFLALLRFRRSVLWLSTFFEFWKRKNQSRILLWRLRDCWDDVPGNLLLWFSWCLLESKELISAFIIEHDSLLIAWVSRLKGRRFLVSFSSIGCGKCNVWGGVITWVVLSPLSSFSWLCLVD